MDNKVWEEMVETDPFHKLTHCWKSKCQEEDMFWVGSVSLNRQIEARPVTYGMAASEGT